MKPELFLWVWVTGLSALVYYFITHGRQAETRTRKLGGWGAACAAGGGIAALVAPAIVSPDWQLVLGIVGGVAAVLGFAGLVLTLWACRTWKRDGRGFLFGLFVGIGGGAFSLLVGVTAIYSASGRLIPAPENSWTWRSETNGFEVRLPSDQWSKRPNPNVLASFTCARPQIAAMVAEVRPAATEADFNKAIAFHKNGFFRSAPLEDIDERSTTNANGYQYWI